MGCATLADDAIHVSARARAHSYTFTGHFRISFLRPSPRTPRYIALEMRGNDARIIPGDHAIARVNDLTSSGDYTAACTSRDYTSEKTRALGDAAKADDDAVRSRGNFDRERPADSAAGRCVNLSEHRRDRRKSYGRVVETSNVSR